MAEPTLKDVLNAITDLAKGQKDLTSRIDKLEAKVDKRFDQMEKRFDRGRPQGLCDVGARGRRSSSPPSIPKRTVAS